MAPMNVSFDGNTTSMIQQWALLQAVDQRYALILSEISRRHAYYEKLQQIQDIRLIVSLIALIGLVVFLTNLWQQHHDTRHRNIYRGPAKLYNPKKQRHLNE